MHICMWYKVFGMMINLAAIQGHTIYMCFQSDAYIEFSARILLASESLILFFCSFHFNAKAKLVQLHITPLYVHVIQSLSPYFN